MASGDRPKHGTSVQTFYWGKGLIVRLEYDRAEERQSVYLNNRLTSSFLCPPGKLGVHVFRASDPISETSGYFGDYRIRFVTDRDTLKILFEIARKNSGGEDTKWYWYDRNADPAFWSQFERMRDESNRGESTQAEEDEPGDQDDDAYEVFRCPPFDAERMCEELAGIDPELLQELLIQEVRNSDFGDWPYPLLLESVLEGAGCDIKSVFPTMVEKDDDEEESDDES